VKDFILTLLDKEVEKLRLSDLASLTALLLGDPNSPNFSTKILGHLVRLSASAGQDYLSDGDPKPEKAALDSISNLLGAVQKYSPEEEDIQRDEDELVPKKKQLKVTKDCDQYRTIMMD
jgi:hypothetical protein